MARAPEDHELADLDGSAAIRRSFHESARQVWRVHGTGARTRARTISQAGPDSYQQQAAAMRRRQASQEADHRRLLVEAARHGREVPE